MFHFFCRRRVSLVCFQILGSVFCQGSLRLSVRAHGANFLIENLTVRFGAVLRKRKSYGAVRCCDKSYGAGPISVGKTVHNRFFSTVHRMNKPHKTAVSYGYQAFLGAIAKPLFIYSTPYE